MYRGTYFREAKIHYFVKIMAYFTLFRSQWPLSHMTLGITVEFALRTRACLVVMCETLLAL